jgi:hypothetical protein
VGWLGRSIGEFGSQVGEGREIAQDWRAKQQDMQLKAARQKLDELMLPLQLQEIQARLKQMNEPRAAGIIGTKGGGQAGVTFQPGTGYSMQELEGGSDPDLVKQQITKMKGGVSKEFQSSIQSHIDAIDAGADPLKELAGAQKDLEAAAVKAAPSGSTLNRLQAKAAEQAQNGDMAGQAETLKEISDIQKAMKQSTPTMWGTIAGAQQGDPDAIARLRMYQDMQKQLVQERGLAFGQGRLFALQNAWIDGVPTVMTGFEVLQAKKEGKDVTIGGALNAQTRIAYQQLYAEAGPALKNVGQDIKAFDNQGDKLIFARALAGAGQAERGDEGAWFRNVFSQVLKGDSGLSPEGRKLAVDLARLGETMGRFRGVAGLQATDSAMAITMGLLPGPTTPDSAYAKMQLDALSQMIQQAGGIPAMRNQGQGDVNNPTPTQPIIPPPPGFTSRVHP